MKKIGLLLTLLVVILSFISCSFKTNNVSQLPLPTLTNKVIDGESLINSIKRDSADAFMKDFLTKKPQLLRLDIKDYSKILNNSDRYSDLLTEKLMYELLKIEKVEVEYTKILSERDNLAMVEYLEKTKYEGIEDYISYFRISLLVKIDNKWFIVSDTSKFVKDKINELKSERERRLDKFKVSAEGKLYYNEIGRTTDKYKNDFWYLDYQMKGKAVPYTKVLKDHAVIF